MGIENIGIAATIALVPHVQATTIASPIVALGVAWAGGGGVICRILSAIIEVVAGMGIST